MNALVETAQNYIGYDEKSGLHKIIINIYNNITPLPVGYRLQYNDPWCAGFVSAMAWSAGYESFPFECSCGRMLAILRNMDLWVEDDNYTPAPGDLIMYSWGDNGQGDNTRPPDHVGIVESVSNGYMSIIEGNYNNSVERRKIALNGRYIRGFGLTSKLDNKEAIPDWAKTAVNKAVKLGVINGDETGKLNLSNDLLRVLVILNRLSLLDK